MAFEVKRINPLDRQPRKAVGISLPFTGQAVFNSTFTTKDAIKNNIINFFLTGKGERFLNPGFGTSLRNLLFDNITEEKIQQIDSEIKTALRNNFPSVVATNISTTADPDNNTVNFSMNYEIAETGIEDFLNINFEQ
mgnify:FL=1|tara:strand:+ start:118 stop:528 length:411 start_codon:yes stop_codon:yes gene_type:complete